MVSDPYIEQPFVGSGPTPNKVPQVGGSDLQSKEKLPHHDANLLQIYHGFKRHIFVKRRIGKTFFRGIKATQWLHAYYMHT